MSVNEDLQISCGTPLEANCAMASPTCGAGYASTNEPEHANAIGDRSRILSVNSRNDDTGEGPFVKNLVLRII